MSFSFNAALSGLNAGSNALNVVGNNIANANTIGFRSGTITFMDVFASRYGARLNGAGNSLQIGDGVKTGAIHTNFSEGNLTESASPLHAAIQGNGFFVVKNADGTSGYTRAGDFTLNNKGFMVMENPEGEAVVESLTPGKVLYVSPRWAHRSVCTSRVDDLVTFFIYPGNAGHDYGTIEQQGFRKLVLDGSDGIQVVDNPRWHRA